MSLVTAPSLFGHPSVAPKEEMGAISNCPTCEAWTEKVKESSEIMNTKTLGTVKEAGPLNNLHPRRSPWEPPGDILEVRRKGIEVDEKINMEIVSLTRKLETLQEIASPDVDRRTGVGRTFGPPHVTRYDELVERKGIAQFGKNIGVAGESNRELAIDPRKLG